MTNLTILYLLNLIVLISGFLFGLIKKRAYSIFWLSLLAFHLVSLIDSSYLIDNYSMYVLIYGQELMLMANVLLFIMIISLDFLIIQQKWIAGVNRNDEQGENNIRKYVYFIILLLIISFAIRLRGGISVLHLSWEEVRDTSGLIDSFANMLCFIAAPVFWMVIKKRNYFLIVFLGLLFFLQVQISGSRAIFLVFGCSILLSLINSSLSYSKRLAALSILGIIMFLSHTLLRLIRGISLAGLILSLNAGFQIATIEDIDLSGGESKIYSYYYYVLENDIDQYPYKSAVTLKRLGLLYLPASIFPDMKPADITYQLWTDWVKEDMFLIKLFQYIETPGSLHPVIWGDAYMNAGMLGMFLYPLLFGFIFIFMEYFLQSISSLGYYAIAPIVCGGYMMMGRGNVVIGIGYIGYIVPMILLIMFALRINIFNLPAVKYS